MKRVRIIDPHHPHCGALVVLDCTLVGQDYYRHPSGGRSLLCLAKRQVSDLIHPLEILAQEAPDDTDREAGD